MMLKSILILFAILACISNTNACLIEATNETFAHDLATEPFFTNSSYDECRELWFSLKEIMGFTFQVIYFLSIIKNNSKN